MAKECPRCIEHYLALQPPTKRLLQYPGIFVQDSLFGIVYVARNYIIQERKTQKIWSKTNPKRKTYHS
jgi:hypothetical protein